TLTVGRPCSEAAWSARRSHLPALRAAIHGNHPAPVPVAVGRHFSHKRPFAIRRCLRPRRHATGIARKVYVAFSAWILASRHNAHRVVRLDLGEQKQALAGPAKAGGVTEPCLWIAAAYRRYPGVPVELWVYDRVCNPRPIRGKRNTLL